MKIRYIIRMLAAAFAALVLFGAGSRLSAQVTLPYLPDFESGDGYSLGSIHAQDGWLVTQGSASVGNSVYYHGSYGVEIASGTPPGEIVQSFDQLLGYDVTFVDFYLRPVAATDPEDATLTDTDVSRLSLLRLGAYLGEVYVYNGDGLGGGTWVGTGHQVELNGSDQATAWIRYTVRLDFTNLTWDLFLDGQLVSHDLAFTDDTKTYLSLFSITGNQSAASYFDYFYVGPTNPLFTDADHDGMDDAWETTYSLNTSADDRNADPDGDGLTNIQEFQLGTSPQTADTDGDGMDDHTEWLLGTDPLVADSYATALPVSGAVVHLQSDRGVIVDGSGKVTTWKDQSGNSNDATPPTSQEPALVGNQMNGRPVIRFDGSTSYLNLPDCLSSLTAGEVFVVTKLTDYTNTYNGLIHFGTGYATVYNETDIWNDFGTDDQSSHASPGSTLLTGTHIFSSSITTGGTQETQFNGEVNLVQTGRTVTFSSAPQIGADAYGEFYKGDIAEVIVYDHVLTSTERNEVLGYLGAKYAPTGITTPDAPTDLTARVASATEVDLAWTAPTVTGWSVTTIERKTGAGSYSVVANVEGSSTTYADTTCEAGQTYTYRISQRSLASASSPTDEVTVSTPSSVAALPVSGALVHLRSDVGVTIGSGGVVTGWSDQSGNGHDAVPPISQAPALVGDQMNGQPVLRFDGTAAQLNLPDCLSSLTAGEVFVVTRLADYTNTYNGLIHFGTGYATTYGETSVTNDFGTDGVSGYAGPGSSLLTQVHIFNSSVTSEGQQETRFNGTLDRVLTGQTVAFSSAPTIGSDAYAEFYKGDIAEVIVYDHVLTTGEREQIGQYLTAKYAPAAIATPDAPTLRVVAASFTSTYLSWDGPGVAGTIERKTGSGDWEVIADVADAHNYTDEGLTSGQSYSYRIKTRTYAGESDYSETVALAPPVADAIPDLGMRLRLRADLGVVQDENGHVSIWTDQSGRSRDAEQSDSSLRPALVTNVVHGQPVVRFDGTDDLLVLPQFMADTEQGELIVVFKAPNFASREDGLWQLGGADGAATEVSGATKVLTDDFGRSARSSIGAPVIPLTDYVIYSSSAINDGWSCQLNGVTQYSTATNEVHFGAGGALGTAAGRYLQGDIAEVIAYDHPLSTAERKTINGYLFRKYHIRIAPFDLALDDPDGDADGDGLTNSQEAELYHTDLTSADTDGDGMSDAYEIAVGLNPFVDDATGDLDGDGVPNNEDARPNDPLIGRLAVTIVTPAA